MQENKNIQITMDLDIDLDGTMVKGKALGTGNARTGKYDITYLFDTPLGNAAHLIASYTNACGCTDSYMLEERGGRNFMTLSGGNYRFTRKISFGDHGYFDVEFFVTRTGEFSQHGVGKAIGRASVPPLVGLLPTKAVYVRQGPGRLASMVPLRYVTQDGDIIPGSVFSEFEYEEFEQAPESMVRTSSVHITKINPLQIQLNWFTTVESTDRVTQIERIVRERSDEKSHLVLRDINF